jgi:hypothetical protein
MSTAPKTSAQSRDEVLSDLFETVVSTLTADLKDATRRTPAHFAAAIKLLNDNQIEALPVPGSGLKQLHDEIRPSLPFKLKTG